MKVMSDVSRRNVLLGGAAVLGGYLVASPVTTFAVSVGEQAQAARFMQLSQLLVNHQLDPQVGALIARFAAKKHADLDALADSIIGAAAQKQAKTVDDFFDDIPAGPAKDLAHWIIFAWYTGCSSAKPDAEVFTFEQALTFQTTADVVAIPSYGLTGPNQWSQVTVPLSPVPAF